MSMNTGSNGSVEWPEVAIADLCNSIDYGYTASATDAPVGPKLLRITDIVAGYIDWNQVPFCHIDDSDKARFKLDSGDVVIARTGASTGASAFVQEPPDAVFASYLVRLSVSPSTNPRFLAYYLRSSDYWDYIHGVLGDKSAQPNASAKTLTRARLRVPPRVEQDAIAAILGALDDKIELNRRMNETLEAMARAVFKSWFVDFVPVRAKAEGRQPAGMDAATAALFPSEFENSPLGKIPKGWKCGKLDEFVTILSGGTPKTSVPEYWGGDIPWFSVADAPQSSDVFVIRTERTITQAGIDNSATQILPKGTTVISARGTVGKLALLGVSMAMNQSCYGIRGHWGDYFTYCLVSRSVSELAQSTHGTVFNTITRDTFRVVDFVLPPEPLVRSFEQHVDPVMKKILANLFESETLAELRDSLLPKLISGEIRLKDAERTVGTAI